MMRHTTLKLCMLIACLLWSILTVTGQEDTAPNWCYEGEPWGDGRCNNQPTDADNQNFWLCGYWNAKVDSEEITLIDLETIAPQCTTGYVTIRFPQPIATSQSTSSTSDTQSTSPDNTPPPTSTDDTPPVEYGVVE